MTTITMHKYTLALLAMLALSTSQPVRALTAPGVTDTPENPFLFIDNQQDNNRFIAALYAMAAGNGTPRMTGSSDWTSLKGAQQKGLGYVDLGLKMPSLSPAVARIDMWEEGPISTPYINQHCFTDASGCDTNKAEPSTSAPVIDSKGFYGLQPHLDNGQNVMAKLSPNYFSYLDSMQVGNTLSRVMHLCATAEPYNAPSGQRCTSRNTGNWSSVRVKHKKVGHLTFIPGTSLSEILVDSNGTALVLPGSAGCKAYTRGNVSGVLCRLVDYTLLSDGNYDYSALNLLSKISDSGLDGALGATDVQVTADEITWANKGTNYPLNNLKGKTALSMFLSNKFFKEIVDRKLTNQLNSGLLKFNMTNSNATSSGFYEFNATTQLVIKPRQYSVSILSASGSSQPELSGTIGKDVLSFPYHIAESGPRKADKLEIRLAQNTGSLHQGMCTFYPANITNQNRAVAIPTRLKFDTTSRNNYQVPIRCDSTPIDLRRHNIKESQPSQSWTNPAGITSFYRLNLEFDLTSNQAALTTTGQLWEGEVRQSGTLTLTGTWN